MGVIEMGSGLSERYTTQAEAANDPVYLALRLLHGRACEILSEIHVLLASGHPNGARARWRTLHELSVYAILIYEHGEELAERYLDYCHIEDLADIRASGEPIPHELAELRDQLRQQYGKLYCKPGGWAAILGPADAKRPPDFAELERLAQLADRRTNYKSANHGVHAGSRMAWNGLVTRGQDTILAVGSTNAGLALPGILALETFFQLSGYLLVYGWEKTRDVMFILTATALAPIVEEATAAFIEAEEQVAKAEAAFLAANGNTIY
ncbi:MAG: hypothetical protein HY329_19255 [Chloroflexi bacterium]|nr:hypothetical protein [Chloroflexota bacterium]